MRTGRFVACAESVRVQAYFDAELDALACAEIERHIDSCPDCRSELAELEQLRTRLRAERMTNAAPSALRNRILRALDIEDRARATPARAPVASWRTGAFWAGAASGLGAAALTTAVVLLALTFRTSGRLLDSLVADHLRSIASARLISVQSSDRHTVKPWFAAHADVSPAVADFAADGYRLIGGRAEPLLNQRVAVLVFQHGAHVIEVFAWAAEGGALPRDATRRGYHLAFWQVGDVRYCAVSDTAWEELRPLVARLRALAQRESG